jgi:hypothetical protein
VEEVLVDSGFPEAASEAVTQGMTAEDFHPDSPACKSVDSDTGNRGSPQ